MSQENVMFTQFQQLCMEKNCAFEIIDNFNGIFNGKFLGQKGVLLDSMKKRFVIRVVFENNYILVFNGDTFNEAVEQAYERLSVY